MLAVESNARADSDARQRIRYAGFPTIKTIIDFDFTAQPAVDRVQIAGLEGGGWLAEARQHRPAGPARRQQNSSSDCARHRRGQRWASSRVRPGHGMDHPPGRSAPTDRLDVELRKISRYVLIVIDEVSYVPFETEDANLDHPALSGPDFTRRQHSMETSAPRRRLLGVFRR